MTRRGVVFDAHFDAYFGDDDDQNGPRADLVGRGRRKGRLNKGCGEHRIQQVNPNAKRVRPSDPGERVGREKSRDRDRGILSVNDLPGVQHPPVGERPYEPGISPRP